MRKALFYIGILISIVSLGQTDRLTYQQAVELTLKNNYDILIARTNESIAETQNNYGNAGFLPKIDLNGNASTAINNTRQEFSNGLTVNKNGVASSNITAGAYLSWTIFDGMKMFATKERLSLLEQQGELSVKIQVENTLELLSQWYYQIVKQEQLIRGINASMDVSKERIKLAEKKIAVGSGSQLELLQAKLDLNAQKSNLIAQQNFLVDYKSQLLVLTKSDLPPTFSVDTVFAFEELKTKESLLQNLENSNSSMLFAKNNQFVSKQIIREFRSQQAPRIGISTNYLYGKTQNAAGFALLNQNLGLNVGVNFTWNLYNGAITRNQIKVAHLQLQNSSYQIENTKLLLTTKANIAYTKWISDKEVVALETENIQLAEQSLKITMEKMKLGLGNYLEIRESQNTYEAAIARLVNARYNLKVSETSLKKISGELVK